MKRLLFIPLLLLISPILDAKSFIVKYRGVQMTFETVKDSSEDVVFLYSPVGITSDTLYIPGHIEYKGITYNVKSIQRIGNGNVPMEAVYKSIRTVIFEDGIENIENDTFVSQLSIRCVHFPNTLKSIGDNAFAYTGIKNIVIPESVEHIGAFAFMGDQKKFDKIDDKYYRGTISLPSHQLDISEKAFAIVSSTSGRTAVAYFKIVQLPKGTTYRQIGKWYIGKADEALIEEAEALERERMGESLLMDDEFLDRIVEY